MQRGRIELASNGVARQAGERIRSACIWICSAPVVEVMTHRRDGRCKTSANGTVLASIPITDGAHDRQQRIDKVALNCNTVERPETPQYLRPETARPWYSQLTGKVRRLAIIG